MKKIKEKWEEDFEKVTHNMGGKFGHNCEFKFKRIFKQLHKMGVSFQLKDYYSLTINFNDMVESKKIELLIYLITKFPGTSISSFDKKNNTLYMEWHY